MANYFRWREQLGPLLQWGDTLWTPTPYFDTATCNARGDAVEGVIDFTNPGPVAMLAIIFNHRRRLSFFGKGLKSMQIITGEKPVSYIFREMERGWQKGTGIIFSGTGFAVSTINFPTVMLT